MKNNPNLVSSTQTNSMKKESANHAVEKDLLASYAVT